MSRCKRKLRKRGTGSERDVGVGPEETFSISAKEVSGHRSLKLTTLLCPTVTPSFSLFFLLFCFLLFLLSLSLLSVCLFLSFSPSLSFSLSHSPLPPSALCHFYLKRGRVIFLSLFGKCKLQKWLNFIPLRNAGREQRSNFISLNAKWE